jgi:hypothetical protein
MDIKDILSLPKDERDLEIRKLIVPKPWKHKCNWLPQSGYDCLKCGKDLRATKNKGKDSPCPIPDPVALDWNLAMKMRDEAVAKDCEAWTYAAVYVENYRIAVAMNREWTDQDLEHVKREAEWDGVSQWFIDLAQPHHYILAALLAKEEK